MSIERLRLLRGVFSALLLTSGVLIAVSIDSGLPEQSDSKNFPAVIDAPNFSIRLGRNLLALAGTTATDAHESALTQLAHDQLAGHVTETDFSAGLFVPDDWNTLSARLLYLVAATSSASASMDENGIEFRGVTFDGPTYTRRLEFLRSALPAGSTISSEVIIARNDIALGALCLRVFATFANQRVDFQPASIEVRQASYSLLDRIIEFAYDCHGPSIAVTGHSDSAGNEARNLRISRARAQAVVEYLIKGGVATDRLVIEGLGSADPVADNDTARGRDLNRRIEFELR